MKIEGYDVEVSNIGRIVTMTKDKKSYQFFVDDEYNVTELGEVNATIGSGGNQQGEVIYGDYRNSLLYQVNFRDLLNSTDENITKVGTGIEVDETNTYATFDGKSGIKIDLSTIDSQGSLLGNTSKTITLWYRTDNTKTSAIHLATIGNSEDHGGAISAGLNEGRIQFGVGWGECDVYSSALTDEQVYQLYEYGKHNLKDK